MIHVRIGSDTAGVLLARLLKPEIGDGQINLRVSRQTSALYASAKTLVAIKNEPVALVLNADSTEPAMADRVRDDAAEVIGEFAAAASLRILVAVPSIESLLFHCPEAVWRAFSPTSPYLIDLGLISPGDALRKLQGATDRHDAALQIIAKLNDDDITALRRASPVRDILEFLEEVRSGKTLASTTI